MSVPSLELGPIPHPLYRNRVCAPPRNQWKGEHTRLRVRGWGSPNSDDMRKSLALHLLCAWRSFESWSELFVKKNRRLDIFVNINKFFRDSVIICIDFGESQHNPLFMLLTILYYLFLVHFGPDLHFYPVCQCCGSESGSGSTGSTCFGPPGSGSGSVYY